MASTALRVLLATATSLVWLSGPAETQVLRSQDQTQSVRLALLDAEDSRAPTRESLTFVLECLRHSDPDIQRTAVRALGRLERPELLPEILAMLSAASQDVRVEAAAAAVQASRGGPGSAIATVEAALVARLAEQGEPEVVASAATNIGRLTNLSLDAVTQTEAALARIAWSEPTTAPTSGTRSAPAAVLTALEGLEILARKHAAVRPLSAETLDRLRLMVRDVPVPPPPPRTGRRSRRGTPPPRPPPNRAPRLAMQALVAAGATDATTLEAALRHPDEQLRRLAAAVIVAAAAPDPGLVARASRDDAPAVRLEVLRGLSRGAAASACEPVLKATADPDRGLALFAIDLVPTSCRDDSRARSLLARVAGTLGAADPAEWSGPSPSYVWRPNPHTNWRAPAHALVALARLDADQARKLLPRFERHPSWLVRMYAARAAGVADAGEHLERLAGDGHDNVREAAVAALRERRGHAADPLFLGALARNDYQLVITASRALEGTPDRAAAATALVQALDRISAQRRETSRDPRRAILDRLAEVGGADLAGRVRPYARDFDPVIATQAARLVSQWTGETVMAAPEPLPRAALPDAQELARLAAAQAVVALGDGRRFTMRLLPDVAPLNAFRFARLADAGYYDGLAVHRVEPNFVVQGGSPGANEYMGDGPYSRDEVGRSNLRGTVGLSTRGRDTGDAQFYVNLVDNLRLDGSYTVFAEVTEGMDVVDGILEGDMIERVELRRP